jgi:hypothetical protein
LPGRILAKPNEGRIGVNTASNSASNPIAVDAQNDADRGVWLSVPVSYVESRIAIPVTMWT